MTKVNIRQNQHQRRMKRGEQIERRVHSAEPIEDSAEPAFGMWPQKSEPQRKKQKANSRRQNRRRDSLGEDRQLTIRSAKKRRGDKEEIDRHVRQNEKRHERDCSFPFKINSWDVCAARGDPVASAVNDQEQDRQSN